MFGDHRDTSSGFSERHFWHRSFETCQALIRRVTGAGGERRCSIRGAHGIRGNSHRIMQDNNHLQIADIILRWMEERVAPRRGAPR